MGAALTSGWRWWCGSFGLTACCPAGGSRSAAFVIAFIKLAAAISPSGSAAADCDAAAGAAAGLVEVAVAGAHIAAVSVEIWDSVSIVGAAAPPSCRVWARGAAAAGHGGRGGAAAGRLLLFVAA